MEDIKRIDIKEFRERGYLQEVNRRFFHPLGMTLEVNTAEDGTETLGGIWDYRDDPEGMVYGPDTLSWGKETYVQRKWDEKAEHRMEELGFVVQPVTES
jgi:hypothetical protein